MKLDPGQESKLINLAGQNIDQRRIRQIGVLSTRDNMQITNCKKYVQVSKSLFLDFFEFTMDLTRFHNL